MENINNINKIYITYVRMSSVKQIKELEKEGGFNLYKRSGHPYGYFLGKYYRSGMIKKLPESAIERKHIAAFGFENDVFMLQFEMMNTLGIRAYRKENIKKYNPHPYISQTKHTKKTAYRSKKTTLRV